MSLKLSGLAAMAVKLIPDGYHTVTPYLVVDGATTVLEAGATSLREPADQF